MARVFISYRRDDTAGYSGRLYNDLKERLGGEIFMDIDSIPPGQNFDDVIERYVGSSDVVIALIGRNWSKVIDQSGKRRLDNTDDFVRLEIAAALKGGKVVIPVLVQEADMPRRDDLPENIQGLARKQAVEISDQRWFYDVERLTKEISAGLVAAGFVRATLRSTLQGIRASAPAPREVVRRELADAFNATPSAEPLSFDRVREEEYRWLRGEAPSTPEGQGPDEGERELNRLFRAAKFKALCLSGEGMRGAVFGLGVLQALARYGLLDKFDYLSTVSGGGYAGGWLTAWIHRHRLGVEGVVAELNAATGASELKPLRHLRDNRSFQRPRRGLLSDDALMRVFLNLRNLVLNWLVLIPLLLGCLMLPRIYVSLLIAHPHRGSAWLSYFSGARHVLLFLSSILLTWTVAYLTFSRPYLLAQLKSRSPFWLRRTDQMGFLRYCLLPLTLGVIFATVYWAWSREVQVVPPRSPAPYLIFGAGLFMLGWLAAMCVLRRLPWGTLVFAAAAAWAYVSGDIISGVSLTLLGLFILSAPVELLLVRRSGLVYARPGELSLFEAYSLALAGLLCGMFFWVWEFSFPRPALTMIADPLAIWTTAVYAWLSVPVVFGAFLLSIILFVGITSHSLRFTDEDREWWTRVGAWVLALIISWVVVVGLVLFGPRLLLYAPKLLAVVGSVSVLLVLWAIGRDDSRVLRDEEQVSEVGLLHSALRSLLQHLAALFLAVFAAALVLATSLIIIAICRAYDYGGWTVVEVEGVPVPAADDLLTPLGYLWAVHYASPWLVVLLTLALFAFGFFMARAIDLNKYSPHALFRDEIVRVFLNASRSLIDRDRQQGEEAPAGEDLPPAVTPSRDFRLSQIVHNPLPLINCSVSYGEALGAFTFSPLHAGSRGLGYRRSSQYGGNHGTTLGTALSISSARSAGVAGGSGLLSLVLSLLNAGQACWLGNPGRAGNGTYRLSTPRFSVAPLLSKMFGINNEQYPYVELSQGGDFDGLGLYEMAARRVQYVFIIDASYDPDFIYDALNSAVDRVLTDLGIPVELDELPSPLKDERARGRYYALGRIRYSAVDGAGVEDGVLVYVKPVVYGQEPFNVVNYAKANRDFPHERGADYALSYTQFESYRKLGFHAVEDMCAYAGLQPAVQQDGPSRA